MEQQRITANELAQKLVNSRKIMKKVETGDYETGNINEELLISAPENVDPEERTVERPTKISQRPIGTVNSEKINQSKLPDNIKKAMIENPIPQITLNDDLNMDFVNKTRKLMEQEGIGPKSSSKQSSVIQINLNDLEKKLSPIIENIIRKVMDEKLSQILSAQQLGTINESLVLKVGDSIFHGKITGVKSTKTNK
jgi:hypothetical protein